MTVLTHEARVIAHALLPAHCVNGMIAYFDERRPTGGFLAAVLANDLIGAFAHADDTNKVRLHDYAMWLYNYAPSRSTGAWGSYEAVQKWLAGEVQL